MCLLYLFFFLIYPNVCRASSTSYLITFVSFGKFLVSISLNSSSATFSSFGIPVTHYTFLLCPMCSVVFYVFHNFSSLCLRLDFLLYFSSVIYSSEVRCICWGLNFIYYSFHFKIFIWFFFYRSNYLEKFSILLSIFLSFLITVFVYCI